jgi:hypothetical protein
MATTVPAQAGVWGGPLCRPLRPHVWAGGLLMGGTSTNGAPRRTGGAAVVPRPEWAPRPWAGLPRRRVEGPPVHGRVGGVGTLLGPGTTGPAPSRGSRLWPGPCVAGLSGPVVWFRPPRGAVGFDPRGVVAWWCGLLFGNCIVDASILFFCRHLPPPGGVWRRRECSHLLIPPPGIAGWVGAHLRAWPCVAKFFRAHGGCLGNRSR